MTAAAHASQQGRRDAIREIMERRALDAVALRRPANFAWYTGGADNRVDHSAPTGVAELLITRQGEYVVTNNIEAGRMRDEQTPGLEVVEYPWFESGAPLVAELAGEGPIGSDAPLGLDQDVADEVARLRHVLDADAVDRYRAVGADTAAAMEDVARSLQPGVDELDAAAELLQACRRRGMYAPVAMAAGDDRIARYRHPVSHGGACNRRVMLVVCAERGGLYGNLTRFIDFEPPGDDLRRRMGACDAILERLREKATVPGRTLAEAFADCKRFYAEAGYANEWTMHHQGGVTGYATREVIATPETWQRIEIGNAFAWNPSITGAKAEETFVLTEQGPEILTARQDGSG